MHRGTSKSRNASARPRCLATLRRHFTLPAASNFHAVPVDISVMAVPAQDCQTEVGTPALTGMRRTLTRYGIVLILALLASDIGDNLVVRYRIQTNREAFGSVQVKRYLAIRHKDQRVEFVPTDPETRPCVNSLFPQFGNNPCWYVSRNKVERIDM